MIRIWKKAINTKFKSDLTELDQVIKRDLRKKNMLGRQARDERLYMEEDLNH